MVSISGAILVGSVYRQAQLFLALTHLKAFLYPLFFTYITLMIKQNKKRKNHRDFSFFQRRNEFEKNAIFSKFSLEKISICRWGSLGG